MRALGRHKILSLAVLAAEFLLGGLIILFFVRAIMTWVAPESVWIAPPATAASSASQNSQNVSIDLSFDPFNRDTVPGAVDLGLDVPETSLNLKLTGLRSGEPGMALLQTSDGQQRTYAVGEEIISGVTLKAVHPTHIVLMQNGQAERLTFDRGEEQRIRNAANEAAIDAAQQTGSVGAAGTAQPSASSGPSVNDFLAGVNLVPVKDQGRTSGYRLSDRSGSGMLAKIGLQDGDILTHIGSENLTVGTPRIDRIVENLSGKSSTTLRINRGGILLSVKVGL